MRLTGLGRSWPEARAVSTTQRARFLKKYFFISFFSFSFQITDIPHAGSRNNGPNQPERNRANESVARKNGRPLSLPFPPLLQRLSRKKLFARCRHRPHPHAQAGFIPRGGVLVDDPFLNGLIEGRYRFANHLLSLLGLAAGESLSQLAQRAT